MIQAVTFDLWDTLVVDDSDERVRAERGLLAKIDARRAAFVARVVAAHPSLASAAPAAWDGATAWFRHCWKVEHHTPPVRERVARALAGCALADLPDVDGLITELEDMEVDIPPVPAPGVHAMLDQLAGAYRLGVVSDAIVTPGRGLRRILEQHDLLRYFEHFVFSDEVGASKPSPSVFRAAAAGLRVLPSQIVHVGDREANDVVGPHAVGARAILYTGVVDRGAADSRADAVAAHHDAIPRIVAGWSS